MTQSWHYFLLYFVVGIILGSILYRSDFCMSGILRDVFLFKDTARLWHLTLAILLTAVLFALVQLVEPLRSDELISFRRVSLLGVAGGLIFGVGMVLAGGCVFSTLYKMGGGNLTYLLAGLGIISGSILYAELFPWVQHLEQLLSVGWATRLWSWNQPLLIFIVMSALTLLIATGRRSQRWLQDSPVAGYLQPLNAAGGLAVLNTVVYFTSSLPLGISTAYAKIGAWWMNLFAPSHAAQLTYYNRPSLVITINDVAMSGGGGPQWDWFAYTEGALLVGILLGAFFTSLWLREFRISGLPPLRQGIMVFFGGTLLALGARIAHGCNIKHLLGGVPLLSTQSFLFVGGMVVGIGLGTLILPRLLLR